MPLLSTVVLPAMAVVLTAVCAGGEAQPTGTYTRRPAAQAGLYRHPSRQTMRNRASLSHDKPVREQYASSVDSMEQGDGSDGLFDHDDDAGDGDYSMDGSVPGAVAASHGMRQERDNVWHSVAVSYRDEDSFGDNDRHRVRGDDKHHARGDDRHHARGDDRHHARGDDDEQERHTPAEKRGGGGGSCRTNCLQPYVDPCCLRCPRATDIYAAQLMSCCGHVLINFHVCPRNHAFACGVHGLRPASPLCNKLEIKKCLRKCPYSLFFKRCLDRVVVCEAPTCVCGYPTLLTFDQYRASPPASTYTLCAPSAIPLPSGLQCERLMTIDVPELLGNVSGGAVFNALVSPRVLLSILSGSPNHGVLTRPVRFGVVSLFVAVPAKENAIVRFTAIRDTTTIAVLDVHGVNCKCPLFVQFPPSFSAITKFKFKVICEGTVRCRESTGGLTNKQLLIDNMALCL